MHRVMNNGALARFRVLDISQVRAGPTCVKQLADFGADVIKIEPPDRLDRQELYVGPRDKSDMLNLHRNKRSMTLDLKADEGRAVFLKLVETADVVVENFRPDVKTRLGLDYDRLAAVNPRIVLVSVSGFGQDGPYRGRPGFDQILQGMCGLMAATGAPDGPPMRAGAAVVDMAAGLYAALGTLTSRSSSAVSGRGQWVQTSLLHAGIALMDFQAARYLVEGEVPARAGNDHPTSMPTSTYPTADGHLNIGAGNDKQWAALCGALGRPELCRDRLYAGEADRATNRVPLNRALAAAFATRTTAEWLAALDVADVPAGPVYTMDQVFDDPQVRSGGIVEDVVHPRRGPVRLIGQAAVLDRTPGRIAATFEDKGGSTREVLAEAGFTAETIDRLAASGVV